MALAFEGRLTAADTLFCLGAGYSVTQVAASAWSRMSVILPVGVELSDKYIGL
jgi:hypothetical protein